MSETGVIPTRKLIATAATMLVIYLLRQVVDVDEELEQIVNLVVPLAVAYLVPNSNAPGGVPDAEPNPGG